MSTQLQVTHEMFASIEEMLSPSALSEILQDKVSRVQCRVSQHSGFSGSEFYQVLADDRALVMKRLKHLSDWISIATDDARCRSVRLWQYGVLDRIRPYMEHVTLAACHDGDEYALLLEDISHGFIPEGYPSRTVLHCLTDALVAIHARYWEDTELATSELGLCNAEPFITFCWPAHTDRYEQDVPQITRGWDLLFEMLEPDARDGLQSLMTNTEPLLRKLATYPRTLLHGDYRPANLAFLNAGRRVVALDWQLASYGPVVVDLAWFLLDCAPLTQIAAAAAYYRRQLTARIDGQLDDATWQTMLDVAYMTDILRRGNWSAYYAVHAKDEEDRALLRNLVKGFDEMIHAGLRWL